MMILTTGGKSEIQKDLQRIAKRHSRADLDIRAELYSLWLDCLIQAAREYAPPFYLKLIRYGAMDSFMQSIAQRVNSLVDR